MGEEKAKKTAACTDWGDDDSGGNDGGDSGSSQEQEEPNLSPSSSSSSSSSSSAAAMQAEHKTKPSMLVRLLHGNCGWLATALLAAFVAFLIGGALRPLLSNYRTRQEERGQQQQHQSPRQPNTPGEL